MYASGQSEYIKVQEQPVMVVGLNIYFWYFEDNGTCVIENEIDTLPLNALKAKYFKIFWSSKTILSHCRKSQLNGVTVY